MRNYFYGMKNHPYQITKHHIIPTSRKTKGIEGVAKVERWLHELYHFMFGNMTPQEIIPWLNKTFWNDMFEITIKLKK